MAFLPTDRPTASANTENYFKPQDGDNRIRILSDAIVGFVYWTNDNKPVRCRTQPNQTPNIRTDENGKADRVKLFWAMIVWDYTSKQVCIWEITQRTIQDAIENLADDEDWGHPKDYDLKINKSGKGLDVKYSVIAVPKKPIAAEIETAIADSEINLQSLFSESTNTQPSTISTVFEKFENALDRADSAAKVDQVVQWALAPRQIDAMTEILGENARSQIASIAESRKTEFSQPQEKYEDIPF